MSSAKPPSTAIPPELDAEMTPAVREFVQGLLARIGELERRVGLSPQNSSLPPSSQHPHAKPPRKKGKSKKKRGGQPGHPKHERPLIPSEQCNEVHPLKPTECRRCAAKLSGSDLEPLRHQVWELPETRPQVTEYQLHRLECKVTVHGVEERGTGPCFRPRSLPPKCFQRPKNGPVPDHP